MKRSNWSIYYYIGVILSTPILVYSATYTGTATGPELDYVHGVTSAIQTQLNAKQAAFGNQSSNTIYAGPTSGADAAPTWRTLVAADIPTLDQTKVTGLGAGSSTPGVTFNDTDASATGTAFIAVDAATAGQDSILQLTVDDSAGEDTIYVEVDGVAEDIELKKVLVPEGGIQAITPVIDDPDNFAANFTGANLYGGTFIANAAGTAALPDPAVGMHFTYVLEGANANIIDPLGTGTADTIYMNGLAAAADENITSSTSGAICVFQYRSANTWMATCNGFAEATPP